MNKIAEFIKQNRKANGLTQEEFAIRSGLGLRFVRELEQGKETVRMDKVMLHYQCLEWKQYQEERKNNGDFKDCLCVC